MALLDIENLTVEFPDRHGVFTAVRDVTLSVERGEILGIVGESGAGKSTIGNAIMGLLQTPGRLGGGTIALAGEHIEDLGPTERRGVRGKRIGMIFQDPMTSLNPIMTVENQLVETILQHIELTEKQAQARALELLVQVGIENAAERIKQYPHQFSGGMRQRVVIALALCAGPELIIADEPTTALDVSIQAQILELIKRLCREEDVGVILVTHDMGVIAETTDRVAVMYRGDLVETGTTEQILHHPEHEYTKSLIAAVPPSNRRIDRFAQVSYIEKAEDNVAAFNISNHWLGRAVEHQDHSGTLLSVENLVKDFPKEWALLKKNRRYMRAVDDVSFEINSGETFGLVGGSGSGKSTIARVITGIHPLTNGRIIYAGKLLKPKRAAEDRELRRQIQMIFQDPFSSLNARMRIGAIVAEPIIVNKLASSNAEAQNIATDLLSLVGLGPEAVRKYPHEFSGGQRQRISIARALASRPRFLICDEPTSALDVSIQAQILNLMKDLQAELNLTMLFISHDLPVIGQMCDRIGVLRHGTLVEMTDAEAIFEDAQHNYSLMG